MRSENPGYRGTLLGVSIALGAGIGLLFGLMLGQPILGMIGGAGAGVVVGAIREGLALAPADELSG